MDDPNSRADDALANLHSCLRYYAARREPPLCVGQFLDAEGCTQKHEGVYGTSGWIVLTQDSDVLQDATVRELRGRCIARLIEWVDGDDDDPGSSAAELKRIVPKICSAFDALRAVGGEADAAANRLKRMIKDCQKDDGWGFNIDSQTPHPVSTCYVLRSFKKEPDFDEVLRQGFYYLRREFGGIENVYERLFVSNSILAVSNSLREMTRPLEEKQCSSERIKDCVRSLRTELRFNPAAAANPFNVDFDDTQEMRTRYLRLPTDILLLEALGLLSQKDLLYLRAGMGSNNLEAVAACVATGEFKRDTVGQRAAVSTMLFVRSFLQTVLAKERSTMKPRLARARGWWIHARSFGIGFTWHVRVAMISLLMALVIGPFSNLLGSAFVGSFVASFFSILRDIHAAHSRGVTA